MIWIFIIIAAAVIFGLLILLYDHFKYRNHTMWEDEKGFHTKEEKVRVSGVPYEVKIKKDKK